MTPIKVEILNYLAAREFLPLEPTVTVRIFDPGATYHKHNMEVALLPSEYWIGVIKSCFDDYDPVTYEINGVDDIAEEMRKSPLCFTLTQAEQLLKEFQKLLEKKPTYLMVHCNAGMSRSPATARALCEIFNLTPAWIGKRKKMMNSDHFGNRWVYQALLQAAKQLGI